MKTRKLTGCAIVIGSLLLPFLSRKYEHLSHKKRTTLSHQIHTILQDDRLRGTIAGVSIRSSHDGELLFDHHGQTRLTPASNMKLITAAAALDTLGPDYKFMTEVFTDQSVRDGIVTGNLYLKGKGDPTLLMEDFEQLSKQLKNLGINRIEGNLIGDESWYDTQYLSEDIIWSDEHEYYGAQVSALTASPNEDYDAGTILVEVSPGGEVGSQSIVSMTPETDTVSMINNATTVNSKLTTDLQINRVHGTNSISVNGEISIGDITQNTWVAIWHPAKYALNLFRKSLQKQGIEICGQEKLAEVPDSVDRLLKKDSIPLSELLTPFMKLSNNGHAEVLVKEMGKFIHNKGSFDAGLEVIRSFLFKEGLNPNDLCLRDGSGISQVSLVQPNLLTALLYRIQTKHWFETYLKSLPIAGVPERLVGGTLRNRLENTAAEKIVRAKTGTLIGVSSLSGYVQSEKPLIFSVILNHFLDEEEMEQIEDQIAVVLATYKS
ncbi:MAG: D-alanyl-D-alanine carboxypeptidase/D-alanyl-D-alanine-endopeptidase [Anaerobacillus sp.]